MMQTETIVNEAKDYIKRNRKEKEQNRDELNEAKEKMKQGRSQVEL
jgi:hypothetical protein